MKTKKYKNLETWTKAMQKDTQKKLWADWFNIGGHWYTQEEFDENGKYMRYTSITDGYHIDIDTSNRYSPLWLSDMKATKYEIDSLRFDIGYYLELDGLTKNTVRLMIIWLWDRKFYKELKDLSDLLVNHYMK